MDFDNSKISNGDHLYFAEIHASLIPRMQGLEQSYCTMCTTITVNYWWLETIYSLAGVAGKVTLY